MSNSHHISKPSIRQEVKPLFALMIPILITQFSQTGLGLIDTIMAGRLSAYDLAAISVSVGIWIPITLLFCGIVFATTPLIARALGENNTQQVIQITQQALILAFFLGLIALIILQCISYILPTFNIPNNLIPKVSLFLKAIGFGMPAVTTYTALRCYSEALGFPKVITIISIGSLFVLIPLNFLFMYTFNLGGAGCGFATAILEWFMLLVLVFYLAYSKNYRNYPIFNLSQLKTIHINTIKNILALGFPIGLSIFFEVSIFSTAALVLSPLGEIIIAGHQVTLSITSILFMIPMSLALALTIRIGYYYGEKNWQAMILVQKLGFLTATTLACCTMLILWLTKESIIHIYTQDNQVASVALSLIVCAIAYQLVDAWQVCASGCLRGMQDTKIPMWIMLFAYWAIAFPIGFYLVRYSSIGAIGIWIGFIIGLTTACILLIMRLYRKNKKLSQYKKLC